MDSFEDGDLENAKGRHTTRSEIPTWWTLRSSYSHTKSELPKFGWVLACKELIHTYLLRKNQRPKRLKDVFVLQGQ